ncbi:MAG: S8 family serine peptidase [Lautropia sp.]|nr:S8 family serine peptidase [Lautropia sp.]
MLPAPEPLSGGTTGGHRLETSTPLPPVQTPPPPQAAAHPVPVPHTPLDSGSTADAGSVTDDLARRPAPDPTPDPRPAPVLAPVPIQPISQTQTDTPAEPPPLGVPAGTPLNSASCDIRYRAADPAPLLPGKDPLLEEQWHLHNDGRKAGTRAGEDLRVRGAWAMGNSLNGAGRGEGIRIAIIDNGLEVTHPDLWPNIVPGGSYNYRRDFGYQNAFPMPCAKTDGHGTAVAGVIAARDDNAIGISGVAPRAGLVGLNAIATDEDGDILHALSYQSDRNHIYNNSWGAVDSGQFQLAPSAYAATITQGLKSGRGGLGAIYVFAAGNGGCLHGKGDHECQGTDLSTYDNHVTQLGTIAVCATNAAGNKPFYSEPGANLLVCAPSAAHDPNPPHLPSVTTTVLDGEFTDGFGGTSAAAPMVSGVVALMLQANPRLTWRDVRLVLARSARQVNPDDPGWTQHAGLSFHHEFGFGVVNAEEAVRLARHWPSVGGSESLKTCEAKADIKAVGVRIPEVAPPAGDDVQLGVPVGHAGLNQRLSIPASCDIRHIEHVELTLSTGGESLVDRFRQNRDNGSLHITLTSPSGQTSTLATPRPCYRLENGDMVPARDCGSLQSFSIGITRHLEEPASVPGNADWQLGIVDLRPGSPGRLLKASIKLYGR